MQQITGRFERLADGTWGAVVRCGGRGEQYVGRPARLVRRDKMSAMVTLGEIVQDYGQDDVVIFRIAR